MKNPTEQGLKILTPDQIFSKLPVILLQLQGGKNSQKLKTKLDSYYITFVAQKISKNNL